MISSIPFLGDVFDLIGNKLCFKGGCPADQENFNGLCYTPCRAGFKSDNIAPYMCYKQYPDWERNGMLHTFLNMTKKMESVAGSVLSDCPAGMVRDGALCYPGCRSGYTGVLNRCWASIQKVNIAGRIPDKKGCGDFPWIKNCRDDGTSLWEDHRCRTWECGRLRGAFGEDWGPKWCTECGGCGCIKVPLGQTNM